MRPEHVPDLGHHLNWLWQTYGTDAPSVLEAYKQLAAHLKRNVAAREDLKRYCFLTGSAMSGDPPEHTVHWRNGMRDGILRIQAIARIERSWLRSYIQQQLTEQKHGRPKRDTSE